MEQCSGLVGDAWYPIPVPQLAGTGGDPAGEGWQGGLCPSPELWEQLGHDGPWSGAQKGNERLRDSSLIALGATVLCWGLPEQGRV